MSVALKEPFREPVVYGLPPACPDERPVPTRPKGPRWVTVAFVSMAYGAAYLLAWFVVRGLT